MSSTTHPRAWMDRILIATFLAAIASPLLLHLVSKDDPEPIWRERRTPAPAPRLSLDPEVLRSFPEAFEAYYDDHFRGRTPLVRAYHALWLLGLGTSPNEMFFVGKDGWLFATVDQLLPQHRGLRPLQVGERAEIERLLRQRIEWARACGSRYVLLIGPNKHSIHEEQLPDWAREVHGPRPLDQLLELARGIEGAIVVDVREELRRAALERRVYYEYGTHWNVLGAQIAYQALARRLAEEGVAITPRDSTEFEVRPVRLLADSWGESLHLPGALMQEGFEVLPREPAEFDSLSVDLPGLLGTEQRVSAGPDSLVILFSADSFGMDFLPFLKWHATRLHEVRQYTYDPTIIGVARPDLVVQVVVERNIPFAGLTERPAERDFFRDTASANGVFPNGHGGTYTNPLHGPVALVREEGTTSLIGKGQRFALEPLAPSLWELRWRGPRTCVVLEGEPEGGGRVLRLLDENLRGPSFIHEPVADIPPAWRALTGVYRVDEARWHVVPAERSLAVFHESGQWLGTLLSRGPDEFELVRPGNRGRVTFQVLEGRVRARFDFGDDVFEGWRD